MMIYRFKKYLMMMMMMMLMYASMKFCDFEW